MNNSAQHHSFDRLTWALIWLGVASSLILEAMTQFSLWQHTRYFDQIDYDPVLRILRVMQFLNTGNWMNDVFPAIDPPAGMIVPWTHPLDVVLAAGGLVLHHWMPLRDALLIWSMALSPLFYFILIAVMVWAARPVLNNDSEKLVLILFLFLSVWIQDTFYLLRCADHHALTLIFEAAALGALLRGDHKPHWYAWAGIFSAIGMWNAIEGFALYALIVIGLGIGWLMTGDRGILQRLKYFCLAAAGIICLAWPIEHLPAGKLFVVEHDRLSIVHVVWLTLTAAFVFILSFGEKFLSRRGARLIAAGIGGAIILAVMQYYFPGFYHGPMQAVDPWLQQHWAPSITEIQPLKWWQVWPFLPWYILAYAVVCYEADARPISGQNYARALCLILLIGFSFLTVFGVRWIRNFDLLCWPFAALGLIRGAAFAANNFMSAKPAWWRPLAQFLLCGAVLYAFSQAHNLIVKPQTPPATALMDCNTGIARLSQFSNWDRWLGPYPVTVMTTPDAGLSIVFWTGNNVLTANYHRDLDGFLRQNAIQTAPDSAAALAAIRRANVNAMILCQPYPQWLDARHLPSWLSRVEWPESNEKLSLTPRNERPLILRVK